MKRLHIEIKKLPNFKGEIKYAHSTDSGCDLTAGIEGPISILPKAYSCIPTGIAVAVPEGYEAQVRARSGLAFKNGIGLVNGIGTIDCGYSGEIWAILFNIGDTALEIKPGDRICQLVFNEILRADFIEVTSFSSTDRGENGFGSTGV